MIRGGNKHPTSARGGLADAEVRGASARAQWIREGLVVLGPHLAQAWGIPQEALATTSASGEVVSIHIDNCQYYPAALLSIDRLTAGAICRALRNLHDTERVMFWLRDHGALGGRNVALALKAGTPTARVNALAEAWARERTYARSLDDEDVVEVANAVRDRDCALRLGAEWSPELDAWPASSDDTSARASPASAASANLGSVHERKRRRPLP